GRKLERSFRRNDFIRHRSSFGTAILRQPRTPPFRSNKGQTNRPRISPPTPPLLVTPVIKTCIPVSASKPTYHNKVSRGANPMKPYVVKAVVALTICVLSSIGLNLFLDFGAMPWLVFKLFVWESFVCFASLYLPLTAGIFMQILRRKQEWSQPR